MLTRRSCMLGFLSCILLSTLLGPGVAVAGDKCNADLQTCLDYLTKMVQTKGWLGIHYERCENPGGYTITKVVPESPADMAGFRAGDIVVAMNGISLASESDELKAVYAEMTPGNTFTYKILRKGQEKTLKAKLGKMPEEIALQMIGAHMLEHASVEPGSVNEKK